MQMNPCETDMGEMEGTEKICIFLLHRHLVNATAVREKPNKDVSKINAFSINQDESLDDFIDVCSIDPVSFEDKSCMRDQIGLGSNLDLSDSEDYHSGDNEIQHDKIVNNQLQVKFRCLKRFKPLSEYEELIKLSKRKRSRPKNLYQLYCCTCDLTMEKIDGVHITKCLYCENPLEYNCKTCGKRYKSVFGVSNHAKFSCSKTNIGPGTLNELRDQIQMSLNCNRLLRKTDMNLENRVSEQYTSTAYYQCRKCKKLYCNSNSLQAHMKFECNKLPMFACSKCSYRAKQKGNLQSHIKRKHTIQQCSKCKKTFDNNIRFKKHQFYECNNTTSFICSYCSHAFSFKTQLNDHIRSRHTAKFICKKCGKGYIRIESLRRHLSNACDFDQKYECAHCSYASKFKGLLLAHLKCRHKNLF